MSTPQKKGSAGGGSKSDGADGSPSKRKPANKGGKLPVAGRFSMVRSFALADFITLGNGVCGSGSILCSATFLTTRDVHYLWKAIYLLPLAFVLDTLDGKVARWRQEESLLGQELDSLADLISFSMAPAMLAFAVGMDSFIDCVVLVFFVSCGLARLARYNATVELIKKETGKAKITYFEGTPVPTTLALDLLVGFFISRKWIHDALPFGLVELSSLVGQSLSFHPIVLLFGLSGAAQISKSLKVPKPFA